VETGQEIERTMRQKFLTMPVVFALLACGVLLTVACTENEVETPGQVTPTQFIEDITPQEAFILIEENADNAGFIIIDTRTPEEFASGHIEGAINVDLISDGFRDTIGKLDRDNTYLVYCVTAIRSRFAAEIMEELGFENLYNLLGGIGQWEDEGLPVIR